MPDPVAANPGRFRSFAERIVGHAEVDPEDGDSGADFAGGAGGAVRGRDSGVRDGVLS